MYIYDSQNMIPERIKEAETILKKIKVKHAFITGSFLYEKEYEDIDLFIISRSKKIKEYDKHWGKELTGNPDVAVQIIDFNTLHSLFYHSISKSCVSKNTLPKKALKQTMSHYWDIINVTVPEILNNKKNFRKFIRSYVITTHYIKYNKILTSYELRKKIFQYKDYISVLDEIFSDTPEIFRKNLKKTYIKRLFYEWAGQYKRFFEDSGQRYLYLICQKIYRGVINGGTSRVQKYNHWNDFAKI